jgi:hypothetical protein
MKMKKVLAILIALMVFVIPAALADVDTDPIEVGAGLGIGIGITPDNSCPAIMENEDGQVVDYFIHTWMDDETTLLDLAYASGWAGRSYAFEGETVAFVVDVQDADGLVQDCVKVYVTLDNGDDPIEAACVLDASTLNDDETEGTFRCLYTVEPTEGGTEGEYWISVKAQDGCGTGCSDSAAGVISLYLNPAVGLSIESQDEFGFDYDAGGDALEEGPFAGDTVYTPYFTVENAPDDIVGSQSGLYLLLQVYGTDMWDYASSGALCPTSNVLDIGNVEYKASHLNVQQDWVDMNDGLSNVDYVFQETNPMDPDFNFLGNFLGVGDDITMRLRLNIPTPCIGTFENGGMIVFVGQVL